MTSKTTTAARRAPDRAVEIRMGDADLTVSGFLKHVAADTVMDTAVKVLKAESVKAADGATDKGG